MFGDDLLAPPARRQMAGVWDRIHRALLDQLNAAERIDWSRAVVDSSSVRAVGAGEKTEPNPTDRRKPGSKHHLLTDARGVILAVLLTAASCHDVTQLLPLVDAFPPIRGRVGRPRQRPERFLADRAYDSEPHRKTLRARGINPIIAKRRTRHGSGLGRKRYVVERSISRLHRPRRLRIRYDIPPISSTKRSSKSAVSATHGAP